MPGVQLTRATWDETWLRVAVLLGQRSQCVRAQVGAVIVTADNRVDSTSYNGPVGGLELEGACDQWCERAITGDTSPDYSKCQTIHAEANALTRANHERIQGGTIYVSTSPCINCAKMIGNAGLTRVVYRETEGDGYRNPVVMRTLLESAGLTVVPYRLMPFAVR